MATTASIDALDYMANGLNCRSREHFGGNMGVPKLNNRLFRFTVCLP